MSDKVFKLVELTGTSTQSIEDAVQTALANAAKTGGQLRWFQVVEIRGAVDQDQVAQWQVTLKIGAAEE